MANRDRHETITHPIGPLGVLGLRTVSGTVRVRATDGGDARVEAHYRLRWHGPAPDNDEALSPLQVSRRDGELHIEVGSVEAGGVGAALARIIRGQRVSVDFDVQMPRAATLRFNGVSADVDVDGLTGEQDVRTVSGDVRLRDVAGRLALTSVSGDVSILAAGAFSLRGTTTSGDLTAQGDRIDSLEVRSVSGDIELFAPLAPGVEHRVETVSGDLEVLAGSGLRVEATGFSTSIRSELPHRAEGHGPRRVAIVGDGSATLGFRSMSGDVRILAGPPGAADLDARMAARRDEPDEEAEAIDAASPDAEAADDEALDGDEGANATELSILEALERGEIDVDEASQLLEGVAGRE